MNECTKQHTLYSTGNSDQLNASSDEESVSSSVDALGTQDQILNDNFSDVDALPISADVSGRGSPNISGRDTPLSVHTEQPEDGNAFLLTLNPHARPLNFLRVANNEGVDHEGVEEDEGVLSSRSGEAENVQQQNRELPPLPTTSRKENRADIDEKFFKFEIPQPTRRERHTYSPATIIDLNQFFSHGAFLYSVKEYEVLFAIFANSENYDIPTATFVTPAPILSTIPPPSWPKITGNTPSGSLPLNVYASV
uniref:Uncharacterized protein n=1 Tax=Romanomermis culicivorax TaxID=13658 RepID=A0A915HP73_ROMCU